MGGRGERGLHRCDGVRLEWVADRQSGAGEIESRPQGGSVKGG